VDPSLSIQPFPAKTAFGSSSRARARENGLANLEVRESQQTRIDDRIWEWDSIPLDSELSRYSLWLNTRELEKLLSLRQSSTYGSGAGLDCGHLAPSQYYHAVWPVSIYPPGAILRLPRRSPEGGLVDVYIWPVPPSKPQCSNFLPHTRTPPTPLGAKIRNRRRVAEAEPSVPSSRSGHQFVQLEY